MSRRERDSVTDTGVQADLRRALRAIRNKWAMQIIGDHGCLVSTGDSPIGYLVSLQTNVTRGNFDGQHDYWAFSPVNNPFPASDMTISYDQDLSQMSQGSNLGTWVDANGVSHDIYYDPLIWAQHVWEYLQVGQPMYVPKVRVHVWGVDPSWITTSSQLHVFLVRAVDVNNPSNVSVAWYRSNTSVPDSLSCPGAPAHLDLQYLGSMIL